MKYVPKGRRGDKPLVFKSGGSTARIYTVRNAVGGVSYKQFILAYYQGAKRIRRKFSDLEAAKREADLTVAKLAAGESEALKLTGVDRATYLEGLRILRPLGVSLSDAVRQFADAVKHLPDGVTVPEAARFYRSQVGQITRKRVAEVVEEMIEAKSRRSRHGKPASDKYLADLRSRLGKLSKAFQCDLCDITPENIRRFLDELDLKGRTFFNHARLVANRRSLANQEFPRPTGI